MNIMIFSNPSYAYYGYSIVTKNLAKGLKNAGHNVIVFGNVTMGATLKDENGVTNIPMCFNAWGSDIIEAYLRAYKIDILITILDVWQPEMQYLPTLCEKLKIPMITHATIRSEPLSPMLAAYFERTRHIVSPSMFGQKTAMAYPPIARKVNYIPHGVDTSIYYPDLNMKNEMKKKLGYEGKFVFLAVGRNKSMQKNYPTLFHAYKNLLVNYPETVDKTIMHVHAYPYELGAVDLDMFNQMTMSDFPNNIKFTFVKPNDDWSSIEIVNQNEPGSMLNQPNFGLPETEMAKLYNMADCMVSTSEGESFCLPVLESMACGVPQVFPNHTTGPELIESPQTGLLSDIECRYTHPDITDVAYVSPFHTSKNMQHIFFNDEDREKFSKNAALFAKDYDWNNVVQMWINCINDVMLKARSNIYGGGPNI